MSSGEEAKKETDLIAWAVGDGGGIRWWLLWRVALVQLVATAGGVHIFMAVFGMAQPEFRCGKTGRFSDDACFVDGTCGSVTFDCSFWLHTMVTDFDLVCDRAWLATLARVSFFLGVSAGSLAAGMISDRSGRRAAIVTMSLTVAFSGTLATAMPNVETFSAVWFVCGFGATGLISVSFVWCTEAAVGQLKSYLGIGFSLVFSLAKFMSVGLAFFTRDWQMAFYVISAPLFASPFLFFILLESPRWLISKDRTEEAIKVLNVVNKNNGREPLNEQDFLIQVKIHSDQSGREEGKENFFSAMWRSPAFFKLQCLAMFFIWFVASFFSYNILLNLERLTGDLFVNFTLSAALELLLSLVALAVDTGLKLRRPLVSACFASAGATVLLSLPAREVHPWLVSACFVVALNAVLYAFTLMWVYAAELFPTSIRNTGIGACSFVSRLGIVATAATSGLLVKIVPWLPEALLAALALLSCAVTLLLLPETGGKPLPASMEEIKKRRSEKKEEEEKPTQ